MVINTDIKIVGAITDENALDEIENIMRVFAYEQRMKDYMSPLPIKQKVKDVKKIHEKKTGENNFFYQSAQPHILVKGLC